MTFNSAAPFQALKQPGSRLKSCRSKDLQLSSALPGAETVGALVFGKGYDLLQLSSALPGAETGTIMLASTTLLVRPSTQQRPSRR